MSLFRFVVSYVANFLVVAVLRCHRFTCMLSLLLPFLFVVFGVLDILVAAVFYVVYSIVAAERETFFG